MARPKAAVEHHLNVFQYAAWQEKNFEAQASECGYERKTTFYSDFSIAEFLEDAKGIKETFQLVCGEWIGNVEYFTELILSLNWKSWMWSSEGNDELTQLYASLYEKAYDLACEKFDQAGMEYLFRVTD